MKLNMGFSLISLVLCLFFVRSPVAVRSVSASPHPPLKDPFIGIAPEGRPIVSFQNLSVPASFSFFLFIFNLVLFITTDEKYYKTSSDFIKCKDGSKKFSKAQLNDDFCDCPDGTDEPGSSLSLSLSLSPFLTSIFFFFLYSLSLLD
jgi:hypothetical protein